MSTVETCVGRGLTVEVWQGMLKRKGGDNQKVALKVMGPPYGFGNGPGQLQEETLALALLRDLEERDVRFKKGGTLLGHHVIPKTFGVGTFNGTPCIVMEWVDGNRMPEVKQRLSEQEVATTGYLLFHTLDLVHTGLKKTYIDLSILGIRKAARERRIGD